MKGEGVRKSRRSYRPVVEALEALRHLSGATAAMPGLAVPTDVQPGAPFAPITPFDLTRHDAAWDEALTQTTLADLLGPATSTAAQAADPRDVAEGLGQLNRYLSRAWFRAGVPTQLHDDSTQAVYVTLLQNLGRTRFDRLVADVGVNGVRDVLSRETAEGPDFFRAVDTVKKRAQRERTYQPLDSIDVASPSPGANPAEAWRGALQEAMDHALTPREASLIRDSLMGKTPAEIASQWGVAPKTVSNEKTRVLQKLREALVDDLSN